RTCTAPSGRSDSAPTKSIADAVFLIHAQPFPLPQLDDPLLHARRKDTVYLINTPNPPNPWYVPKSFKKQ
ncbi:MAG TPA: hypothetical protein VHY91_16625, partial [Pirellulales bacterium]|nr:hypothetical protein [Pirellulales bacterium]